MAYVTPRVQIEQIFTQTPAFSQQPMAAFIIGPQYDLYRYSDSNEKPLINVGAYDKDLATAYAYPSKQVGTVVDQSYVKLFADNVVANYFSYLIGDTGTPITNPDADYPNRIRSNSLVFKTANSVNRSAAFSNRDVTVGDVVELSAPGEGSLTTKVVGFVAEEIAATVAANSTNESTNISTQVLDITNTVAWAGSGANPTFTIDNTSTAYVGYTDKRIASDTITFEVVTTGASFSALRFKITSAAGAFSTQTSVAPSVAGILTLDDNGTNDVTVDLASSGAQVATDYVAGQKWTLVVDAAVTQQNTTNSGTYTGSKDVTYFITVVRGGAFYNGSNASTCARVKVTSNDVDSSGPVNVTASTAFAVGNYGVLASFTTGSSNGGLILGDIYKVVTTAKAEGAVKTLVLANALPSTVGNDLLNAADLNMTLSLNVASYQVPKVRDINGPIYNWETDADEVTVNTGLYITNSSILDGSDLKQLPVQSATLFIEHRDLMQLNTEVINSVGSHTTVESVLGKVHPDNPLAQAVYDAALNAASVDTYYIAVPSDDLSGYNAALEQAKVNNSVYGVVPLTFDSSVQQSVVAHIDAMSTPDEARWRVAWLSLNIEETALVYTEKSNNTNWTATVSDDPLSSGTQYTLVTISGATLITDGVRVGDKLLINFTTDDTGNAVSEEYSIAQVRTETSLVLASALPAAIVTPVKIQIKRVYSKQEQIDNLAARIGAFNSRRVRAVFPDTVKDGSIEKAGYFVAAACAGLAAGVVPHQGLTNIELKGFTDVSKSLSTYTQAQLNILAENGAFIVTQATKNATPYVRHQLTTSTAGINFSEESITRNVDSISYRIQSVLEPYIGRYNVSNDTINSIGTNLINEFLFLITNTKVQGAGAQLNGYTITKIEQNILFKDRIDVEVVLNVPAPLNYITLKFIV